MILVLVLKRQGHFVQKTFVTVYIFLHSILSLCWEIYSYSLDSYIFTQILQDCNTNEIQTNLDLRWMPLELQVLNTVHAFHK